MFKNIIKKKLYKIEEYNQKNLLISCIQKKQRITVFNAIIVKKQQNLKLF